MTYSLYNTIFFVILKQVLEWLQAMENRVGHLRPVAVDLDIIKQQQDELRPLAKEYRDFSANIDKVC